MQNAHIRAPLTPPTTPPPFHRPAYCMPTPESRIGIFLGESLELKGILGTGAYGVVYSALDHYTQTWYAVKALNKFNPNGTPLDRRQQQFQSREISLHYAASAHPNVVSMLKIVDDPDCTFVILQYCPEGDLFSNITERGRYIGNDPLIKRAFLQILDAVEHCHRLSIYHRDLKPENILVANSGADVLLADFGLATTDSESEDHGCGSTFYMSPECLDQSSRRPSYRSAPNDVWSLGVILVNLTCGRNPWKQASAEDSTYRAYLRNRTFLKTILPLSDEINEILSMIFEPNPELRITVSELKRRISQCRHFAAPPQMLATPPQSRAPSAAKVDEALFSISEDGSAISDEGSLSGSISTLSDDVDSDSDSGYESMEQEQDAFEIVPKVARPAAPPTAPAPAQQYVLPSHEYQGSHWAVPSKNPWSQYWASTNVNQVQPSVVYPGAHGPVLYPNHYQYQRECW